MAAHDATIDRRAAGRSIYGPLTISRRARVLAKSLSNVHRPDGSPNVFVFTLPRSGSTWLMELIWSQPGFKCCDEPTDLRDPLIRGHLGVSDWFDIYREDATARLEAYFDALCDGRLGIANPRPFRAFYRPLTHRIVFKMIHGCEDRPNWFRDRFNGRICYLLRHPIAVARSREVLPTLPALIDGAYARHFSAAQLAVARDVARGGSRLERGVLSWCLQNAVPLRAATPDWAIVTYEQLVLEPEPLVDYLAERLALPDRARMLRRLEVPSNVERKSDDATRRVLSAGGAAERRWLVDKWQEKVTPDEERRLMQLLELFEIDAYHAGSTLPDERYWIGGQTASQPAGNAAITGTR